MSLPERASLAKSYVDTQVAGRIYKQLGYDGADILGSNELDDLIWRLLDLAKRVPWASLSLQWQDWFKHRFIIKDATIGMEDELWKIIHSKHSPWITKMAS